MVNVGSVIDTGTLLAIVALAVALLSAFFTGQQTYLFKRSLNLQSRELTLHENELNEEKTRFLST